MLLFLVDLINIEIFRISFNFFYSFSFILRNRATSEALLITSSNKTFMLSKSQGVVVLLFPFTLCMPFSESDC